ncbi:hypothetical protein B296_00019399 [Ensete ventricosum]|uniref:Uncharacterized protein n=1 Tax=Ensete ventricosum TaxID=4639 RepID=A0A426YIL4_ENSVE|nr:hypothetical protein B296_00019399 [Ensete ventricosum]
MGSDTVACCGCKKKCGTVVGIRSRGESTSDHPLLSARRRQCSTLLEGGGVLAVEDGSLLVTDFGAMDSEEIIEWLIPGGVGAYRQALFLELQVQRGEGYRFI